MIVLNVHLESGPRSVDRDARAQQLQHLSRVHEGDAAKVHIVAGDFNLRSGEDQCLLAERWQDVFKENGLDGQDHWTWRQSHSSARYDRIYSHSSTTATVECVETERLPKVWGRLTDHVAMRAVFRKVAHGPSPGRKCLSGSERRVPSCAASAGGGAAVERSASSSSTPRLTAGAIRVQLL